MYGAAPNYKKSIYLTPEQLSGYSFDGMTTDELQHMINLIGEQVDLDHELQLQLDDEAKRCGEQWAALKDEIAGSEDEIQVLDGEIRMLQRAIDDKWTAMAELEEQIAALQAEADDLQAEINGYDPILDEIQAVLDRRDG